MKIKMKFDGRVENPLSPHEGKRKAVSLGKPECKTCGCDIVEGDCFWFTLSSKKIFCEECEEKAEKQMRKDKSSSRKGRAGMAPILLSDVKDEEEFDQ